MEAESGTLMIFGFKSAPIFNLWGFFLFIFYICEETEKWNRQDGSFAILKERKAGSWG